MITSAIICEYNPFHNGHKYQIEQTRKNGTTHIVAIMSGNFTQRGTPSVISKHKKAEIALKNGCDLIIELPTPYCVASAERFAFGATFLANALNCVDSLSFGCENDNITILQKLAAACSSSEVIALIKSYLKSGISFAAARSKAIKTVLNTDFAALIARPNNILAIEYLKSLKRLNSKIKPMPILRKKCGHNSTFTAETFANSTLLREMLFNHDENIQKFIPQNAYEILNSEIEKSLAPAHLLNCERAILAKLRCMTPEDFLQIADVAEGLENKIYKAIKASTSLNELLAKIKSKRYTQLRIRRMILSAFLDINKEIFNFSPPYIKVLGFNEKGKEILKIAKIKSNLPVVTNATDIKKLKENYLAMRFFQIETRAFDLYNLMLPNIQMCGFEATNQIVKV